MKQINNFINEKLIINKNTKIQKYNYHPKDIDELRKLVLKLIKERGNKADLNDIDTSEITDMSQLFAVNNIDFNGNISKWNVGNVKDMTSMFNHSKFNGDISNWDVSNVETMRYMFFDSKFNGNISNWNVSNVKDMGFMFNNSKFTGKKGDISNWDVSNVENMYSMFRRCPLEHNLPKWYIE